MVRRSGAVLVVLFGALLLIPEPALAQAEPTGLAGLLLRFFSTENPVILREAPDPFNHAAHFVSQPEARQTLQELNRNIAVQLSTFPLASSSAGFTFSFDPAVGVFERNTETFGPIFAERALTGGKGKFSMGVNYLRATYDRFEGMDLKGHDINLYLTHKDTNGDNSDLSPWYEGDVIQATLVLNMVSETTVVAASYGITDNFDLSVAVPFQNLSLDASIDATIDHLATAPDPFTVHAFPDGSNEHVYRESGSASGIGDIVLRGKYNFLRRPGVNLAAAVDVRLPTGDSNNLLGSGGTQAKVFLIASGPGKKFSPRASLGYTASSGGADFIGTLPNEMNYSFGFDAFLLSRVSFTADFLGRTQFNTERVVQQDRTFQFTQRNDPTVRDVTMTTPGVVSGDLSVFLGSAGVKINPFGRLLISGNVLFAVGNNGLQDKLTPVVGIDYTF